MTSAFDEFVQIVSNEYHTLGVATGHEALGNLVDDLARGFLNDALLEFGSPEELTPMLLWKVAKVYFDENKLYLPIDQLNGYARFIQPVNVPLES